MKHDIMQLLDTIANIVDPVAIDEELLHALVELEAILIVEAPK